MTDNTIHHSAPVPVGDVVPGDPPVPITVWPVPAPERGETMSNALGVRLVHNLTHRGELIVDLTTGPQLARAIIAAGRRSHLQSPRALGVGREPAALVVTGWPLTGQTPADFFGRCRTILRERGCAAVVLAHGDPALPADVVAAARAAGLGYLQHVVAATDRSRRHAGSGGRLDIHTDLLILSQPAEGGGDDDDRAAS